jgi:hypothetical protein
LAWVGTDGFPLSIPVLGLHQSAEGFQVQVGTHLPGPPFGPACLTLHTHPEEFTGQENHTFIGEVRNGPRGELSFVVQRALADWSLTGNKVVRSLGFLRKGRQLKPRLASEAARRGQPVPTVRLP